MDYVVFFCLGIMVGFFGHTAVALTRDAGIKRENERLNRELHRLTDRDSRGRFKGGK